MSNDATPRPVYTLLWRVLVAPETFLSGRDGKPRVFTSERAARTVVHGAARGVDTWAGTLASRLGLLVASVPADWDGQGVAAGPIRNRLMIDRGPVGVIALPGGKGTYDMVKAATARNVPVFLRDDPQLAAWRRAG